MAFDLAKHRLDGVDAQRLAVLDRGQRVAARQTTISSSAVMNSLPSCSKRCAMFTVSPITVKFTLPGAPILPTMTGPECRPMRTRIASWPGRA